MAWMNGGEAVVIGELPEAFVILAAVVGSFASLRMTSVEEYDGADL